MYYTNQNRDRHSFGYGESSYHRDGYNGRNSTKVTIPKPEALPTDYLTVAEKAMMQIAQEKRDMQISTSKLRNLYSLAMSIYDKELRSTKETLSEDSVLQLERMQIRIIYECGRDKAVKEFVDKTKLLSYLKGLGTIRKDYLAFAHYMEALVAYHRYLKVGGNR